MSTYRRHNATIFHHDIPIARCTSQDDAEGVVERLNNLERALEHARNPPPPIKFTQAGRSVEAPEGSTG